MITNPIDIDALEKVCRGTVHQTFRCNGRPGEKPDYACSISLPPTLEGEWGDLAPSIRQLIAEYRILKGA